MWCHKHQIFPKSLLKTCRFPSSNTLSWFLLVAFPSRDMHLWASSYEYQGAVWSTLPLGHQRITDCSHRNCWKWGGGGSEKCPAEEESLRTLQGSEARPNTTLTNKDFKTKWDISFLQWILSQIKSSMQKHCNIKSEFSISPKGNRGKDRWSDLLGQAEL